MALYQRRLASSTWLPRCSLENRRGDLDAGLKKAQAIANTAPPDLPDADELEEMDDADRERIEEILEAISLAGNPEDVRVEIGELLQLAEQASQVEEAGVEAKLSRLKALMHEQGFFDDPDQRLLLFTEFKDTLDYLVERLRDWGFRVGCIHGGMRSGSRDEPGTRLQAEQQFKDGVIQILVATEAAGEGINLQCCHILFNYDIPWNPNRLEQRMGRIHRYGQTQRLPDLQLRRDQYHRRPDLQRPPGETPGNSQCPGRRRGLQRRRRGPARGANRAGAPRLLCREPGRRRPGRPALA